jgi:hypothetical protein
MAKKEDSFELDITKIFSKFKLVYLLLFLMICFGFYLRFYHIQYPVIGYHNWKVAHYISEARNFEREGFFKYGFFVPMRDTTESIAEPSDGEHNDTFPTEPILVGLLFKIFGESLVLARMLEILFSLASVILFYLLVKELFDREDLALLSAFLAAINPMYVFFTQNIDVINSGLFFMLLGAYFYIRWLKHQVDKNIFSYLYIGCFFAMMGAITKYTFAVIFIPMLFVFPFKKILKSPKKFMAPLLIAGLILAGFPLWFGYSEIYVKKYVFGRELTQNMLDSYEMTKLIDFSIIWSSEFWTTMRSYVADNFTIIGILFSFIGMALFATLYLTKNKGKLGYNFMMAYLLSIFAFVFIVGYKLSGHNYHQFPIAPLIIFMMAYFMIVISGNIASLITKKEDINKIIMFVLICLILLLPPATGLYAKSMESKNRMYDTQFPGLDIAGDYVKEHKNQGDRVVHSSGQSYGFLWHADMRGYKMPPTVEYFKRAENEFNVSWVFMYQWGIQSYFQNAEVMEYIRSNYRLVEFAFIPVNQQQVQPLFFLFRKGGSFNESQMNSLLQQSIQEGKLFTATYYYTKGPYEVKYIKIE